jgi:hypothetical protein
MQLMKNLMQEIIMMNRRGGHGIRGLASAFDLLGTVAKHFIPLVSLNQVTALRVPAPGFEELLLQTLILVL